MTFKTIFGYLPALAGALAILGGGSACTGNFEEMNTNSHQATEDMMGRDNLKTGAFFIQLQKNVVLFEDKPTTLASDYQIGQGLSSDIYSGYVAPTGTWEQGVHNGSYFFITNWIHQLFDRGFVYTMAAWNQIKQIAEEQGTPHVGALATVVKVESMHRVADTYGPIPYLSFGSGSLQNNYDSLEAVYTEFFRELDEAIDILTEYVTGFPGEPILEDYDLVYGGDAAKWLRFANSLRLRLAMRVVYANPELAQTEAEKSISNPYGCITTVAQRAELQRSTNLSYIHPLYQIAYEFNAGEARMSASMDSYLNGYQDPRLGIYFKTADADGGYHGVRLGITGAALQNYAGNRISNLNMNNSSTPIVWMTAAESYFLRAEGALRGWAMGDTARNLYEKGIEISFEENGASGAAAYYASTNTRTPIAFVDAVGSNSTQEPPSTITVPWQEGDFEQSLERIITQKWIAMYPDGPEGWAEFRRTGYPRLLPVVNNRSTNNSISTEEQVRRLPYPQSEYQTNAVGVATGVALLGGADNGGTKLWWDKKNQ